jgi:lipid-binding SYLF domain-containing protein
MVRNAKSGWSAPAFYTLGSVTFGLQIGGEAAQVVMLAMSQKAVDSLMSSSVRLGGDLSLAVGPLGAGAKAGVALPDVRGDFVSFTKAKGLYGGLNLEGSALGVRDTLNEAYYGERIRPSDIIAGKGKTDPAADQLRDALSKVSSKTDGNK